MTDIHWLNPADFLKAKGQLRLQVGEILSVFHIYGLQDYIPGAIEEILEVADDYSKRLRGEKNQPIRVKNRRRGCGNTG